MKVKHIEMLECVESRTLFKILGRHRAIRELNKGRLSRIPKRLTTGERSIMHNVFWRGSRNERLWSELYTLHNNGSELYTLHNNGPQLIKGTRRDIGDLRKYYRIKLVRAATCE